MRRDNIYIIGTRAIALLTILCGLSSCASSDSDDPITGDKVAVSLALSVTTSSRGTTRILPSIVQPGSTFSGVEGFRIVPFSIPANQDIVLSTDVPTGGIISNIGTQGNYYLTTNQLDLNIGTNAFLCYAKAKRTTNYTQGTEGDLKVTWPAANSNSKATSFSLVPIQSTPTTPNADAVKILEYMNSIATKFSSNAEQFKLFTNDGGKIAGSSRNIIAYVNEWYTKAGSIATIGEAIQAAIHSNTYVTVENGKVKAFKDFEIYPAGLPDGTAVMTWNATKQKFEYDEIKWDTEATEPAYVFKAEENKFGDYVYPAERYFFANSRIYTSEQSRKDYYTKATWDDVLDTYENKGDDNKGVIVDPTTRSVAIKNPLCYGVAGMEIRILAKTEASEPYLRDDDSKHTAYEDSKVPLTKTEGEGIIPCFPLTAIIVGSQVEQNYNFEPAYPTLLTEKEYAIYDTQVKGVKTTGTDPATVYLGETDKDNFSAPIYTIGLQTKDELSVKVVLEFINNSNKDFISENGIIYRGTKFYMVASVVPPGDMGFEKRVLTRGYMTTVNLTIGSLKTAYNALPDLRSDKLRLFDVVEAGIRKWQVGQTGEHEVFNW